jgi:hypothetical protein
VAQCSGTSAKLPPAECRAWAALLNATLYGTAWSPPWCTRADPCACARPGTKSAPAIGVHCSGGGGSSNSGGGGGGGVRGAAVLRHITSISLSDASLAGTIPAAIGALTRLQTLDLSNNKLVGSVPAAIGALTRLQQLLLGSRSSSNNRLVGPLPWANLSTLPALTTLNLDSNRFCLPRGAEAYANCTLASTATTARGLRLPTTLSSLWLQNNEFGGTLPAELALLSNLTSLGLAGNFFTGPIPAALPWAHFRKNPGFCCLFDESRYSNRFACPLPAAALGGACICGGNGNDGNVLEEDRGEDGAAVAAAVALGPDQGGQQLGIARERTMRATDCACAAGTAFNLSTGACSECSSGKFGPKAGVAGKFTDDDLESDDDKLAECKVCPKGQWSPAGAIECAVPTPAPTPAPTPPTSTPTPAPTPPTPAPAPAPTPAPPTAAPTPANSVLPLLRSPAVEIGASAGLLLAGAWALLLRQRKRRRLAASRQAAAAEEGGDLAAPLLGSGGGGGDGGRLTLSAAAFGRASGGAPITRVLVVMNSPAAPPVPAGAAGSSGSGSSSGKAGSGGGGGGGGCEGGDHALPGAQDEAAAYKEQLAALGGGGGGGGGGGAVSVHMATNVTVAGFREALLTHRPQLLLVCAHGNAAFGAGRSLVFISATDSGSYEVRSLARDN